MRDEAAKGEGARIRKLQAEKDAGALAEILSEAREAASWSEADLRELALLGGVSAYVSERGTLITGMIAGRRVLDEAEILNLAVRPEQRRQGEGTQLLEQLLGEFRKEGVTRVFLEVRESNAGAIAFYERLGFRAVGKRRDYYQEPSEAATVMELWLKESTR